MDLPHKGKNTQHNMASYCAACNEISRCEDCAGCFEEREWEYHNYVTEKTPAFGEVSYRVACGGLHNGNAYATIELKKGKYYYCEYGKEPSRSFVGNRIEWNDAIYDKNHPYEWRLFDIHND
jgi:hypothetical protein